MAWNIRQDTAGGLDLLVEAYNRYLNQVFGQLITLHAVAFALTLVIVACFAMFMLRPLLVAASGETRRIAELLSQLPKDIDIEAVVQEVIQNASGTAPPPPPPPAAIQAEAVMLATAGDTSTHGGGGMSLTRTSFKLPPGAPGV